MNNPDTGNQTGGHHTKREIIEYSGVLGSYMEKMKQKHLFHKLHIVSRCRKTVKMPCRSYQMSVPYLNQKLIVPVHYYIQGNILPSEFAKFLQTFMSKTERKKYRKHWVTYMIPWSSLEKQPLAISPCVSISRAQMLKDTSMTKLICVQRTRTNQTCKNRRNKKGKL